MKKSKKKKKGGFDVISLILILIALGILGFAGFKLYGLYQEYQVGTEEYNDLRKYAAIPADKEELIEKGTKKEDAMSDSDEDEEVQDEDPDFWGDDTTEDEDGVIRTEKKKKTLPYMENPIDFGGLKAVNPDVIGWIEMEGPDISYPIAHGADNDFYLHHTIEGTYNFAGSIFVDAANSNDFSDPNTVIYGHNMKNGSMFAMIKKYGDQKFYEEYPYFWIYTPMYIYKCDIFSAKEVDKNSDRYQIRFQDRPQFASYLEKCVDDSAISAAGIMFNSKDRIITLSTCTGDSATRFVVQGKIGTVYRTWKEEQDKTEE